jgi:hypothetical protein
MDEEEELENTLIGQQEEAPAIDTGDALMGKPSFLPYADDVAPSRVNALSVFTPGGDLKPGIDVNAITPSPTTLPEPSAINTALNQEVSIDPAPKKPNFFEPGGFGYEYLGPRLGTNLGEFAGEQLYGTGITAEGQATGFPVDRPSLAGDILTLPGNVLRGLDFVAGPPVRAIPGVTKGLADYTTGATGVQAQQDAQRDTEASTQVPSNINLFTGETIESPTPFDFNRPDVTAQQQNFMDANQQAVANAMANQNQQISNAQIQGVTQGQETTAPSLDQTLSQFMRNEDSPEQRTEQFVDPQGRLRRRLTPEASALQGFAPGVQPLAPEYTDFERDSLARQQRIGGTGSFAGDSAAREARLRANERQPGESQAAADTRAAQSRTTGGQTEGLSFEDARRRARGQLAGRNPSASDINSLARAIQAAEPERLAELETKRAINEARLKTAQATLDRPEFEGKVYTVNGVTFAQTSRGGAQVIDTGSETPEQSTAQIQNFEFTLDQIDKAREAYSAGDVDRANDILTAAGIQKNGIDVTANEYFGDFSTQVPPAGSTPQVTDTGFTQQQEANIQKVLAANPNSTRADVVEAMEKAGKL